ncbi:AAA family ATPase (plasmid) [Rhizobium grahamii]|uniref:AAA family ATPase n=1 Tax=Rhizobium grahamii TaxID=1120045 RepID=A0A5Q0CDV3_9HYPH|nr:MULTISPECIES: AAA family ATPase [Rhizobium]QFY63532.1 AAA family ATPase [Rhizobium grahamii]QRM51704.1 AAA family ATPase [Rhizobium sp. BG6]
MGDSTRDVIIAFDLDDLPILPIDFIWIKPNDPTWNDFGHVSRAIISRVANREINYEYLAKVAFFDEESQRFIGVGNALDQRRRIPISTDRDHVFSLAYSQEMYRHVIRSLGVDEGVELLQSTNDLVAIAGTPSRRDFERRALASDAFKYSLARESEAYYALKNSKPILRGLDQEDVSSGPKSVRIEMSNQQQGIVEVDFAFNHDSGIPKRTCVLIGKNGVGKSSALGTVARKALIGIQRDASSEDDRVVASRVLAFTPGNEFTGTFPSENWKNPATYYKRFSTSRLRHSSSGNTASASIVELARNDRMIAEKTRLAIFMKAVFAINRPEEIVFRSQSSKECIFLAHLRHSSEQRRLGLLFDINQSVEPGRVSSGRFYHLSTGEVRFIKLLAQACMFIENGSLILLDEPETHLHPNFVARLMSALESLLSDTGSCAIVATHSVYVVREVFHDQVLVVEKDDDGKVNVRVPGMRTFGADISSISSFIFGEDGQSFLADDTVKRLIASHSSFDEIKEKYGSYLSREVLSVIRDAFR